jgi:hypothetical protein
MGEEREINEVDTIIVIDMLRVDLSVRVVS